MEQDRPESLIPFISEYKVSTVLNNDRKVYGKKFLFDGKSETCWNSDQGLPQWIRLTFAKPVTISQLTIQFQGGFAGKDCLLEIGTAETNSEANISSDDSSKKSTYQFTPTDTNSNQEFAIPPSESLPAAQEFRLWFKSSTDFYGRIIIYNFDIIGYHN